MRRERRPVRHQHFHMWEFECRRLGDAAAATSDGIIEGAANLLGYRTAATLEPWHIDC